MANHLHIVLVRIGPRALNAYSRLRGSTAFNFRGANLTFANLAQTNLIAANLTDCDLTRANLLEANLEKSALVFANLTHANLGRARLVRADFTRANLTLANLMGASLLEANLRAANLTMAKLPRASLSDCHLIRANLTHADLSGAHLARADLTGANLAYANLARANLARANLRHANLAYANLTEANLTGAILDRTDFRTATLSGAIFDHDEINHLTETDSIFYESVIDWRYDAAGRRFGFDLSTSGDARDGRYRTLLLPASMEEMGGMGSRVEQGPTGNFEIYKVIFSATSLKQIQDLEPPGKNHPPPILTHDLLLYPNKFPEGLNTDSLHSISAHGDSVAGLRVPEEANRESPSVFLSHATVDKPFVEHLYQRLLKEGIPVWYAPENMRGGRTIIEQVQKAVRLCDRFLLVLSEAVICSKWVVQELLEVCRREQAEKRKILFPLRICPYEPLKNWRLITSEGVDLAEEVRKYYIPDFSPDANFERGFERLIHDIRER